MLVLIKKQTIYLKIKDINFSSDDKKTNQKWQKVLHEKIRQKLTSSVEPQATTELQERNNVKSNKTIKDFR